MRVAALLCLSVAACAPRIPPLAEIRNGFDQFAGSGFTFLYPDDGVVDTIRSKRPDSAEFVVRGPTLAARLEGMGLQRDSNYKSTAEFSITVREPKRTPAQIRALLDSLRMPFHPSDSLEFDSHSTVDSIMVGGEKVFVIDVSCCDCSWLVADFVRGGRLVQIEWHADDDDIYIGSGRTAFWAAVRSFRWR